MPGEETGIRKVVWAEILPWLLIFRCFRIARRVRLLLLAAAGVLVTAGGWAVLGALFPRTTGVVTPAQPNAAPLNLDILVPDQPSLNLFEAYRTGAPVWNGTLLDRFPDPVLGTWEQFSRPLLKIVTQAPSVREIAVFILAGIWAIGVWGYFGAAICRTAALALARDEYISLADSLAHARRKWVSHFAAPLIPLVPVVLTVVGLGFLGLLLRTDWGTFLLGILWPLILLGGLTIVVLGIGVLFGWPLMWGTLATENADAFDAVSRSFSYLFQRPLQYLFYVILAAVLGTLCWILVANVAAATILLSHWAVDWGADLSRWTSAEVPFTRSVGSVMLGQPQLTPVGWIGSNLLGFWKASLKLVAISFLYSFFWTAACAWYLLLRRDVDATEIEEIYLGDRPTVPLPELKTEKRPAPATAGGSSAPVPPPPPKG